DSDQSVRSRPSVEPREGSRNRLPRGRERLPVALPIEAEALGVAHRADLDAEALLDMIAVSERELRAAAAGVEDDDRLVADADAPLARPVRGPALLLRG